MQIKVNILAYQDLNKDLGNNIVTFCNKIKKLCLTMWAWLNDDSIFNINLKMSNKYYRGGKQETLREERRNVKVHPPTFLFFEIFWIMHFWICQERPTVKSGDRCIKLY